MIDLTLMSQFLNFSAIVGLGVVAVNIAVQMLKHPLFPIDFEKHPSLKPLANVIVSLIASAVAMVLGGYGLPSSNDWRIWLGLAFVFALVSTYTYRNLFKDTSFAKSLAGKEQS